MVTLLQRIAALRKEYNWIDPQFIHPESGDNMKLLPLALDDRNIAGHLQNYSNLVTSVGFFISPIHDPRNGRGLINQGILYSSPADFKDLDTREFSPVELFSSYYPKYLSDGKEDYSSISTRARQFIDALDLATLDMNLVLPDFKSRVASKQKTVDVVSQWLSMVCVSYDSPVHNTGEARHVLSTIQKYRFGNGILVPKGSQYVLLCNETDVSKFNYSQR